MREKGIVLTDSGLRCCNPACRAVLYVELMAAPDHEACFECDPEQFREGWHPMIAEAFAQAGDPLPVHCSEPCCRGGGTA
jgi:hypothetical protein